ncbi:alpha-amylase family glycosyl hydrolase [Butyrivibrio sp. MC2013]|uniref:alpha-amylase family glycosyl hydrolase n=1 Tax=Butyrivibrio sp. MC2013 TaxID=1280686 RepID=UPI00041C9165|nr:hypothetical protein [Butyrivibrio sp. MC2013]
MNLDLKLTVASPYPLGMRRSGGDLYFSGVYKNTGACGLVLYPLKDNKPVKEKSVTVFLSDSFKRGDIYSVCIKRAAGLFGAYQLIKDGKCYPDPYSKRLYGLDRFGSFTAASDIISLIYEDDFKWSDDKRPARSYDRSFIYQLHVRGYTMADKSMPSSLRGTYKGLEEKIDYLKSLGVTAIELLPISEQMSVHKHGVNEGIFGDRTMAHVSAPKNNTLVKDGVILKGHEEELKINFWGFEDNFIFAPRSAYAQKGADPCKELKHMIRAFHRAGIEVIVQFYFTDIMPMQDVIAALRYWVSEYHIDGIHIKGAFIDSAMLAREPLFSDIKIMDYGFDMGSIYKGMTPDPVKRNLAEYRDNFTYCARRFLKGDDNVLPEFLALSQETGISAGCVHYICSYEGMRLIDLVSFDHKYNEANGEGNNDGASYNASWNCGVEGPSRKKAINSLRLRQMKNALAMVFLSQGVPMIFGGDEFGNSQGGNNNPYCQDNITGWIDWKAADKYKELTDFVRYLVALRTKYAVFRSLMPYRLMDYKAVGYPDFSYHGQEAFKPDLSTYSHTIGMLYCGLYTDRKEDHSFVYVIYNMHWEKKEFALPGLPAGCDWKLIMDTSLEEGVKSKFNPADKGEKDCYTMAPRSICLFVSNVAPSISASRVKLFR